MNVTAPTTENRTQVLRDQVEQLVNQTFYGGLLREFRNSQQPNLLDRGPGRQTFWRMLDTELIKRMNTGRNRGLTDALLKQLGGLRPDVPAALQTATTPAIR